MIGRHGGELVPELRAWITAGLRSVRLASRVIRSPCRSTATKKPSVPVRKRGHLQAVAGGALRTRPASRGRHRPPPLRGRSRLEAGPARQEGCDRAVVLRRQHRAGDVGDAPARLHEAAARSSTAACSLRAGRRGCRAARAIWRPGCAARCRCPCRAHRRAPDLPCRRDAPSGRRLCPRRADLDVAHAGPRRAGRRSARAGACRCRWRRSGRDCPSGAASASVLPPPPAQRSITCSPGSAAASSAASCEPSSWISIQPFWNAGSACTAGVRASSPSDDPQPDRRHAASRSAPRCGELGQAFSRVDLERVDPEIEQARGSPAPASRRRGRRRRSSAQRSARAIPDSRPRRAPGHPSSERASSAARSASVSGSGAKRSPEQSAAIASCGQPRCELQRAEKHGARRVLAHEPGARRPSGAARRRPGRRWRRGRPSRRSGGTGPNP